MSTDRDRILEQALKHELRAAGTAPTAHPALRSFSEGGCLDAETLGAWTDGSLDPTAMASIEAHVSSCARCQSLVGAMARSTSSTLGTLGTRGTIGTLSLWKWWLAPLAAGVTAVTLWMVVPEQPQIASAPPRPAEAKVAQAPSTETIAPSAPAADKKDAVVDQSIVVGNNKLNAPAREDQSRDQLSEARKEEDTRSRQMQERAALADAAAGAPLAAQAPTAPPPPATVALQAPAASAEPGALQKNARSGFSPNAIEIPTLQTPVRWRIVGDFFIELTEDGGASWQRKHQIGGVRTGSAVSAAVLWLGGGNGSVWLTTDGGVTFKQVGLAEPLDIASVSATDARSAIVSTVSGRRFRTEDAGRTWRPF